MVIFMHKNHMLLCYIAVSFVALVSISIQFALIGHVVILSNNSSMDVMIIIA